jgi:glutamate/tyrosine decarboxylase-like PLP-dependent enzyme
MFGNMLAFSGTTWDIASALINALNDNLKEYSPTTIIIATTASILTLQKGYQLYQDWDTKEIKKELNNKFIQGLQYVPYIGPEVTKKIDKEVNGMLTEIKIDIDKKREKYKIIETIPEKGLSEEEIRERFKTLYENYKEGKLSGAVYTKYDKKFITLLKDVYGEAALTNPMHSEWPLLNLMEAEIISMCQSLLHGEKGGHGIVTSGGSTSILEACKAHVFKARKNGISNPEIIVPETAHVAFDKAAKILNVKLVKIPVDKNTGAADVQAMENAINKNTCMIVGSAPSFPAGIIDPIEDLGKIAKKHNIPLHVDSCLGGFLTVFAKKAGFDLPKCDFAAGADTISIDTHKYGYAPKGSSVLLFHKDSTSTPTHTHLDWVGGMYVTQGIEGSRDGAKIATTWTTLCYNGEEKYINATKDILNLQKKMKEEIEKIDGIYIPYNPQLSVIPIQSNKGINSLLIAQSLKEKGWSVNILQTPDQKEAGFHFCLTSVHANQSNFLETFIEDLKVAVQYAKDNPNEKPKGMAKAYGKLGDVPSFVHDIIGENYIKIMNTLPNIKLFSAEKSKSENISKSENNSKTCLIL